MLWQEEEIPAIQHHLTLCLAAENQVPGTISGALTRSDCLRIKDLVGRRLKTVSPQRAQNSTVLKVGILSAGIEIQFPLVFRHSTQAEEAVKITRFLIGMCFFHLGKADLGCTSMACVYYTPQKKRICIALYGLWTHQTVLSPWETHFAFLSCYSIPSHRIPCCPLPCGFDWFGGCFLFKETLKRWHGSWWQPVFNKNI